jgi:hypothetical protein
VGTCADSDAERGCDSVRLVIVVAVAVAAATTASAITVAKSRHIVAVIDNGSRGSGGSSCCSSRTCGTIRAC